MEIGTFHCRSTPASRRSGTIETAMSAKPRKTDSRCPCDFAGARVTVVGLGRFGGGVGVTRWLCAQGVKVTVSDLAGADALADSIRKLDGLDVTLHLGSHEEKDFLEADLLVVNPAVAKDMPLLAAARRAGVPLTTEINLFLQRCRAPVVGITGSVGKSTTTAMTGEMINAVRPTHVGGNIGVSLLEDLEVIQPGHAVVLELSSFQLEDVPLVGISPHVAVVTNLAPNHLDRHVTLDAYADAKKNIFRFQRPDDVLILNARCDATADWATEAVGVVELYKPDPPEGEAFRLRVPGRHNQANAQAAWAAARHFGVDRASAAEALARFTGLPHRLELVAEVGGVAFYNDSKCTTPEGAVVALESFEPRRAIIIVGGYDKNIGFDSLGAAIAARARGVVAIGQTRERIVDAVEKHRRGALPTVERASDLADAVGKSRAPASPGDVVLLSPACASYDMFTNYEHRGEVFVQLVKGIP